MNVQKTKTYLLLVIICLFLLAFIGLLLLRLKLLFN